MLERTSQPESYFFGGVIHLHQDTYFFFFELVEFRGLMEFYCYAKGANKEFLLMSGLVYHGKGWLVITVEKAESGQKMESGLPETL